ncbi:MAG: DUF222 domain-containing protein, partial [Pseudonocardiaceae bacterium]
RERAEADLAGYARDFDPRRLRIIAHRLVAHLDPDGPAPGEDPTPATPVRGELWLRDRRDGRLEPGGLAGCRAGQHGLCDRARGADDFPTTAGEPSHVTVTIDWDALRTGLGTATLDYGQLISAGDARRLACDCKLIPVVLGGDSEPLDVGRAMRTIPLGIRRAQLLPAMPSPPPTSAPPRLGTSPSTAGASNSHHPQSSTPTAPLTNPLRR